MRFTEIARRLTGISTPVFGVSWNPGEAAVTQARRVLSFLEDRRVLFAPWYEEIPHYCIQSVIEIRQFLTSELSVAADADGDLKSHLRAMRSACRQFCNDTQFLVHVGPGSGGVDFWKFNDALGRLRAVVGIHIGLIASTYGIDIEENLASLLPESDPERLVDDQVQRDV